MQEEYHDRLLASNIEKARKIEDFNIACISYSSVCTICKYEYM